MGSVIGTRNGIWISLTLPPCALYTIDNSDSQFIAVFYYRDEHASCLCIFCNALLTVFWLYFCFKLCFETRVGICCDTFYEPCLELLLQLWIVYSDVLRVGVEISNDQYFKILKLPMLKVIWEVQLFDFFIYEIIFSFF